MDELMIKIDNVSKQYRLGAIGGGTLQGDLQSWWARIRGKEDPNSIIGTRICKKNEKFMALDGISFEVRKGERVGIIGHNGAGKSTLLKLLSRVTAPTDGEICLNGRVASMLEVGTGFHGELTGRENIYMNGAILGMTKAEIDSKMEDIIDFSECRQFIDTPVKRYSSGMYVKLAFSVAAHLDSEIMIMDEVLAVGDMAFQKKCLDKMSQVSETEGRTILYVSHNMNTIRQLCDRCIVLDHGKVRFSGSVEEAISIYLGMLEVSEKKVDLADLERTKRCKEGIRLFSIEILNHPQWIITVGQHLLIKVRAEATKELKDVGFRMRVACADDSSVSVLLASHLVSCDSSGVVEFILDADVSQIVPGKYTLTPSFYTANEFGTHEFYDHINRAIVFEIENQLGFNENMEWDSRYWGNIKLPDLKLVNISIS